MFKVVKEGFYSSSSRMERLARRASALKPWRAEQHGLPLLKAAAAAGGGDRQWGAQLRLHGGSASLLGVALVAHKLGAYLYIMAVMDSVSAKGSRQRAKQGQRIRRQGSYTAHRRVRVCLWLLDAVAVVLLVLVGVCVVL